MEHLKNSLTGNTTTRHWPPPNEELEKFSHPSTVDGYYGFALRSNGHVHVLLMLMPRNPMRGAPVVAECSRNFKWTVTCDYSIVSAVAAAIPRAEVFLRNLYEKLKRPPLPDECEWVDGDYVKIHDKLRGVTYALDSERQASILDALAKEYRRTHCDDKTHSGDRVGVIPGTTEESNRYQTGI